MKKILAIVVSLLLFATPAMAAIEAGNILPVEPGITPDSPLYTFDKTAEKIQLRLTTQEAKKAELRFRIAEERLAEADQMAEENETELAEEAMEDYEVELNETANEIEKAVGRGQNVTGLIEHVTAMTAKHLEVLQRVYDKVPEQAKPAIAHAMEVSVRKQVGVLAHVEDGEEAKERVRQEVENQIAGSDTEIKEKVKENLRRGLDEIEDEIEIDESELEDINDADNKINAGGSGNKNQ